MELNLFYSTIWIIIISVTIKSIAEIIKDIAESYFENKYGKEKDKEE